MTNSLPSDSDLRFGPEHAPRANASAAFDILHQKVQRWVYAKGWTRLREAQEKAVEPILAGGRDVIIAAATASGKTEAAWLPICSALLFGAEHRRDQVPGVKALYISPLKALINDQYMRLTGLCEDLDLPVHRWHGDVASSQKSRVVRNPDGILLITPESVESLFVNHGSSLATLFGGLQYIVVDELHSFIGTERGAQLQSLLHRIELVVRRRVPRIALSATLGDFSTAADFLRPRKGAEVERIKAVDGDVEIKLVLKGYKCAEPSRATNTATGSDAAAPRDDESSEYDKAAIAAHLFQTLRGTDNLIFANTRRDVEIYTDLLNRLCAEARVATEFFAHHGNLSKEIREHVEGRLKDGSSPASAVCTSTLEMGIDIGSVDSIAQIRAPASVAGLRQRLGRSGRRDGKSAILRIYVSEPELTNSTPPVDLLRAETFQSAAIVEMLLQGRYEHPYVGELHLSTLIQQILSVIAQHGGADAQQLYGALCGHGPFAQVDRYTFTALLRAMGQHDLLTQDGRGMLLPGIHGERVINHYTFYTAFQTPVEYRLVSNGQTIGSVPIDQSILPGALLIFAGRRWKILNVDDRQKVIDLTQAGAGRPPKFFGGGGEVADEVRRTMRALYSSDVVPRYLDNGAQDLFIEGRSAFQRQGHAHSMIFGWGGDVLLFPWRGDRIMNTIAVVLASRDLEVGLDGLALTVHRTRPDDLHRLVARLAGESKPTAEALAAVADGKARDKYDGYLSDELLDRAYAARAFDIDGAWDTLTMIASSPPRAVDAEL